MKAPGFTAIRAILTLALGIGANTRALFLRVVNGVLLNPLPVIPSPTSWYRFIHFNEFDGSSSSYINTVDWDKENKSFLFGAWRNYDLFLTGAGEGERVRTQGVQPTMGRVFCGGGPYRWGAGGDHKRRTVGAKIWIRAGRRSITLTGTSYEVVVVVRDFRAFRQGARRLHTDGTVERSDISRPTCELWDARGWATEDRRDDGAGAS